MTERSRTEYSAINTTVAVISRMVAILMGFVTRVIFTHTLSESYVGINGLFTDILNVLSLTELGVGTAITYALYRPIAEKDIRRQQILMRMYRTFYRGTAICVAVAGLALIPFIDVFMKNRPDVVSDCFSCDSGYLPDCDPCYDTQFHSFSGNLHCVYRDEQCFDLKESGSVVSILEGILSREASGNREARYLS